MNEFIKKVLEEEIEKYEIRKNDAESISNAKEFEKSNTILYFLHHIFSQELNNINLSVEDTVKHFKGLFKFLENENLEAYNELNELLNNVYLKIMEKH